mmetsp:Transcript_60402/g.155683  ORF Transcript_60402/g.155683 Transcript_60402/m.155683 type:complete len:359 (-) Transcript_60402:543-1619(-)
MLVSSSGRRPMLSATDERPPLSLCTEASMRASKAACFAANEVICAGDSSEVGPISVVPTTRIAAAFLLARLFGLICWSPSCRRSLLLPASAQAPSNSWIPSGPMMFPSRSRACKVGHWLNTSAREYAPASAMTFPRRPSSLSELHWSSIWAKRSASRSDQPMPQYQSSVRFCMTSWKTSEYRGTQIALSSSIWKDRCKRSFSNCSGAVGGILGAWHSRATCAQLVQDGRSPPRSSTDSGGRAMVLRARSKWHQPRSLYSGSPSGTAVSSHTCERWCANHSSMFCSARLKQASSSSSRGCWCKLHQSRKMARFSVPTLQLRAKCFRSGAQPARFQASGSGCSSVSQAWEIARSCGVGRV